MVFTGQIPHEQIKRYYSLLDVFVCPRKRMRLTELVTPLKPLEAMAMGKPVLGSDVGGLAELVKHDVTGMLFAAGIARGPRDRGRPARREPGAAGAPGTAGAAVHGRGAELARGGVRSYLPIYRAVKGGR